MLPAGSIVNATCFIEIHSMLLQFVHVKGGTFLFFFFHSMQRMRLQNNMQCVRVIADYHNVHYCLQCDSDRCACDFQYIFIYVLLTSLVYSAVLPPV